jgi:hypothetical protein
MAKIFKDVRQKDDVDFQIKIVIILEQPALENGPYYLRAGVFLVRDSLFIHLAVERILLRQLRAIQFFE